MKKRGRKISILKNICTLVITFVLICCSVPALLVTATGVSEQNTNCNTPSYNAGKSQAMAEGDELLLEENFTDGNMPPEGDSGSWTVHQTNPDESWYIDSTAPHTEPSCATVHRGESDALQDEWLITPSLDFGAYTKINLTFDWYTCFYVTLWKRYVELNISVSIDGGANWTMIWSFDDMNIGPYPFPDWTWQDTIYPNHNSIDLSDYAGENDVIIAFQYYSNTTTAAEEQEFSIDDIKVIGKGVPGGLQAYAGGPYSWYWPMQYKLLSTPGVRFHGQVEGASVQTTTLWDFGDGTTTLFPFNVRPIHFYDNIGTYNVSLTATDYSTKPPKISIDYTTVTLFLIPPPAIDIKAEGISIGIKADIENGLQYNATYVNWTINVSWGPFQIFRTFHKTVGNGSIENIEAGTSDSIRSSLYFFGFGILDIEITVTPENLPESREAFTAFKIGPLVFFKPSP